MSSRKKRARASRLLNDQTELAALLERPHPDLAAPTAVTFTLDDVSAAVRYWGDDPDDRNGAKVSGGFGPNACLAIEVLAVMTLSREQTVACPVDSKLAKVVDGALRANPSRPHAPREPATNAIP
ncbi:hypothetical protein LJR175_008349 [Variovorax sp. LjRoot175]|uniref:hypothetical protein n=1 Tax=Variovorax sp. LjRoot175 TaxID=3342276 RepID=UPI003ECE1832